MEEGGPADGGRISVRIYYEDTDFSGRVYHASYLRFLERGRTEWLRNFGLDHAALSRAEQMAFAVTRVEVDFLAPALIDDLLDVTTTLRDMRGPLIRFEQAIFRNQKTLARGVVGVVAIRGDRAVRPPRELVEAARRLRGARSS